ncbi:MAG: UDP-N-acetylmuramyl-tripeptide synthetase [bacterium]
MEKILYIIKKIIPTKLFRVLQPVYHFLLSFVAAAIYGFPSEDLIVIGVTGTTGKTTSVFLIAKMLKSAGYKVGLTSTAMFNDGRREWLNDKKITMPGRFFTQKILREMVKNGCQYAVIETTSEGIRQFRHRFINYDTLIFTGLYPEHIESHGSFENYKKEKGKLFAHLRGCGVKYADNKKKVIKRPSGLKKIELNRIKKTIIINGDDEHAEYFVDFWSEQKIIYTGKDGIELNTNEEALFVKYGNIKTSAKGAEFKTSGINIKLKLLGEFSATNAMNAVCVGFGENLPKEKIKSGLEKINGIPGRMETIDEGQNFTVIVDYAFEPNAILKLYGAIESLEHNKIIHLLGSTGGGRDIARRPLLGKIAAEKADFVIVTNEDPYDDDPQIVIDQVVFGAEKAGKKKNENLWAILDRREAIKKAISLANENDIVLITGKGCEQAICVADGEKIKWDDRKVASEVLRDKK